MLFKLNISGITITSTFSDAHGSDTTNVKIDSVAIEESCSAEEAIKILEAAVDVFNKKKKEQKKQQINAFNQEFIVTVFSFKMSSPLRKQGQKYAIIKNIRENKFYTLSRDGLWRYNDNPYFYNLYNNKIENGECEIVRKFYSDHIPTYEEL